MAEHGIGCPCYDCVVAFGSKLPTSAVREPHIYTPKHDRGRDCCLHCGRPFQSYADQPDTAERKRRDLQAIPFALPEKKHAS